MPGTAPSKSLLQERAWLVWETENRARVGVRRVRLGAGQVPEGRVMQAAQREATEGHPRDVSPGGTASD